MVLKAHLDTYLPLLQHQWLYFYVLTHGIIEVIHGSVKLLIVNFMI